MLIDNKAEYIDAQEAALILGLSQRAVRNLVGQQRLEVKKATQSGSAATRLMVSLASVQRLHAERQR